MAAALTLQWEDGTLVAASGSVSSGWLDLTTKEKLAVVRTHAGGTYSLDIEWSRDGSTTDVTEEDVTVANDGSTLLDVAAPYAKLTVNNDDGANAFTTHQTTVHAR